MILAIDFDGTIVEHRFPAIGKQRAFAFDALIGMQNKGHRLILWTHRSGEYLDAAIQYCLDNGLEFYAVNRNYPEETWDDQDSRKILADIYIDDRNLGGIPPWTDIYKMICGEDELLITPKEKKKWWKK